VSSSLLLAKRLRACDDASLTALITTRLASTAGLRDFFDVADALLARDAVLAALARQPRPIYDELRHNLTASSRSAVAQAFLDGQLLNTSEGSAELCPELVSALESLYVAEPADQAAFAESHAVVAGTAEAAAIEASLATISTLDEIARLIRDAPLKELARGGLNAGDSARLSVLMPSPEVTATHVLALGSLGGLLSKQQGIWLASANLDQWLELDTAARWQHLAQAWLTGQPEMVVHVLRTRIAWGSQLTEFLANEFPVDHSWIETDLAQALETAELLALSSKGTVTELGRSVLTGTWSDALGRVTALVPPFTEHVYVQHDFTIVAPGPLAPADDVFMRQLCTVDSRGLATTFRLTPAGVNKLLSSGLDAASILQQLQRLSATEVPQAVAYLITDLGTKFGSVRVREHEGYTSVRATDNMVLRTIAADKSLSALGLRAQGDDELACHHPAHVVVNALSESKYPAELEDASGNLVARITARPRVEPRALAVDPATALVERLRGTRESTGSDDATWIERQLDVAVREKTILIVSVGLPDGSSRDFTIEPKGLSNGRLRGRDRQTDVERTLPLGSITAVRRAE
jgi:hypothetical protein